MIAPTLFYDKDIYYIDQEDRKILREIAKTQMFYYNKSDNLRKIKAWYKHNSLQGEYPMIHLELATFSSEVIPQLLKCHNDFARYVETQLYMNFLNQKLFDDDKPTPNYYKIIYDTKFQLFGISPLIRNVNEGNDSVAFRYLPIIEDLYDDYYKLKQTEFSVDFNKTKKKFDIIEEAIGDIMPVKIQMDCLYSVPTQMLLKLMNMETLYTSFYDYPDLIQDVMNRIANDTLNYYRMLEREGLIFPTTAFECVGQATFSFNNELPGWDVKERRNLTTSDVWGFMDSQETVGISPEMYEKFIFPCYQRISEQYGLLSYGCCEPVDPIWDKCLSKLKNLRKLSISPWCNEEFMGERLRGSHVIYHRKPNPNFLSVDTVLDEDRFRKHIRKSLCAARGCKMEITQRDVYTIHNNIKQAKHYVDIIREEVINNWK